MSPATLDDTARVPAFLLAALLPAYPDPRFVLRVGELLEGDASAHGLGAITAGSWPALRTELEILARDPARQEELRSDHLALFDCGAAAHPLYETEYGRARALAKGNELADIAGFYRAFGLELGAGGTDPEMPDHAAVELEFYAVLLMKSAKLASLADGAGQEIVLAARKKFLAHHLGRFLPALAARPAVANHPFYGLALGFCRDLVAEECARIGVTPETVAWVEGESEPAAVVCGEAQKGLR